MNPSGEVMLNYGAMSGLSSFAFFLLLYYTGYNPLGQASFLGSWIPIIFICLATGYYRDKLMAGQISYWQSFRIGFLTASSGAFLYALVVFIFASLVSNQLVEDYKNEMMEGLEKTKSILGESFYETNMENLDKTTLFTLVSGDFFSKTLGGFFISLVTAGFYRRQFDKGVPEQNTEIE
jgi:hypothetical protein